MLKTEAEITAIEKKKEKIEKEEEEAALATHTHTHSRFNYSARVNTHIGRCTTMITISSYQLRQI